MSPIFRRRVIATVVVAAMTLGPATITSLAAPKGATPPPTPVPPKGSLSPFPTILATPADAMRAPAVSARSALLADLSTGASMDAKAPDLRVPIASLTKIMTALIALDRADPADVVTVDPRAIFKRGEYGASSTLGLRAGEHVTVENLLYAMLLGSANDAAIALAIDVAGSEDAFIGLMNARARRLGMVHTEFRSVNGLDDRGVSTARDLLTLVRAADATDGFERITATKVRTIPAPAGPPRRIQNRNALLWLYPGTFGTKTGSTALAGSCLIASASRDGRQLIAIVLHAQGEAFSDAAALLNYGFEGFTQQTFATPGADQGTLRIRGGSVPVVAGTELTALVPTRALGGVRRRAVAAPDAAFPPPPGSRVGTLTISIPGLTIGSVPLLVSSVPPPPASGGPWWARAAGSVGRAVAGAVRAAAS